MSPPLRRRLVALAITTIAAACGAAHSSGRSSHEEEPNAAEPNAAEPNAAEASEERSPPELPACETAWQLPSARVGFGLGQSRLSRESRAQLQELSERVAIGEVRGVRAVGYVAGCTSEQARSELAQERANGVAAALIDLGVDADQVEASAQEPTEICAEGRRCTDDGERVRVADAESDRRVELSYRVCVAERSSHPVRTLVRATIEDFLALWRPFAIEQRSYAGSSAPPRNRCDVPADRYRRERQRALRRVSEITATVEADDESLRAQFERERDWEMLPNDWRGGMHEGDLASVDEVFQAVLARLNRPELTCLWARALAQLRVDAVTWSLASGAYHAGMLLGSADEWLPSEVAGARVEVERNERWLRAIEAWPDAAALAAALERESVAARGPDFESLRQQLGVIEASCAN